MKKIFACLVLTFLYSAACQAAKPAIFGVWEQIVVAPANSKSSPSRRNFLFLSGTISTQEIFSGVSDSYDGTICCLKIINVLPVTLGELISKYKWAPEEIEHLQSIRGWSHIYEAVLVDKSQQNSNMKELVSMTANQSDLSPFSAAVVSGGSDDVKIVGGKLSVDKFEGSFSSVYDSRKNIMKYIFQHDGRRIVFSENPLPAE